MRAHVAAGCDRIKGRKQQEPPAEQERGRSGSNAHPTAQDKSAGGAVNETDSRPNYLFLTRACARGLTKEARIAGLVKPGRRAGPDARAADSRHRRRIARPLRRCSRRAAAAASVWTSSPTRARDWSFC